MKEVKSIQYYFKAIKWLLGNIFWGLLPLWFVSFIKVLSNGRIGSEEIPHLIHDGVILFVCCAIMGSALVEFILTGMKLKIMAAYRFAVIPCFISSLILSDYAMIIAKIIDYSCFDINSKTSALVITLAAVYCIYAKADIYIKEDSSHE